MVILAILFFIERVSYANILFLGFVRFTNGLFKTTFCLNLSYVFCTPQNQEASWVDGSEWGFSDWMPGHPNIHTDKPVCVEMFELGKNHATLTLITNLFQHFPESNFETPLL